MSGYKKYILNIPFIHKGAGTRSAIKREEDLALRNQMKKLFLERWKRYLPIDVRTRGESFRNWLKNYVHLEKNNYSKF
jgi:hypothetical protein